MLEIADIVLKAGKYIYYINKQILSKWLSVLSHQQKLRCVCDHMKSLGRLTGSVCVCVGMDNLNGTASWWGSSLQAIDSVYMRTDTEEEKGSQARMHNPSEDTNACLHKL